MQAVHQHLETLGWHADEHVGVGWTDPDGAFHATTATVRAAPALLAERADRDCYLGVAPVRAGIPDGRRGTKADVRGIRDVSLDLDVKTDGLASLRTAEAVIEDVSGLIGARPVVIVHSGHGLQPHWVIERDSDTDWESPYDPRATRTTALRRRFGRLGVMVAERRGGNIDTTSDASRVLRAPIGHNCKDAKPIPVTVEYPDDWRPLALAELEEGLNKYVPERPEDCELLDEEISPPAGWTYAQTQCTYSTAMVEGWATDKPRSGARHAWLVAQSVRLATAHRLGCLTAEGHRAARAALADRFRTRLNMGTKREPAPGEITGALAWGVETASTFTDERALTELGNHAHPAPPEPVTYAPTSLAQVYDVFRKWMGPDYDLDPLTIALAATAASRCLRSDPLWVLVVGGSGNGKTEVIAPLEAAGAVLASDISSVGALLSGTSDKERTSKATGGLLREVGDHGVLLIKDVTTILSMNRETRNSIIAALREVHDGQWTRALGVDGGRSISWKGHCTVIGAVTTAWDEAHAVISTFGDRFVLVRPRVDARAAGASALESWGQESVMRQELRDAVGGLLTNLTTEDTPSKAPGREILDLADVVTWARTAIISDYKGEVLGSHEREAPTRFSKQLATVYQGSRVLGVTHEEALRLVRRAAADTLPPGRLAVLRELHRAGSAGTGESSLTRACRDDRISRTTVQRLLAALDVLRLAESEPDPSKRWPLWRLADDLAPGVIAALGALSSPEKSENP